MDNKFDQKVINFNEWLLNKIEAKEIPLIKKLNLKVTVHDNCYSKSNGERYWNNARELIQLSGCEIIEMEHNKKFATCCGFGAGASWTKNFQIPFKILNVTRAKFAEAEKTGAEALVTYCGGCLYLLWAAKELFQSKLKLFHHVELVRAAMGESIDFEQKAHKERAWDIIAIISYHLFLGLFHKPFQIEQITFATPRWKERSFLMLRMMRNLLRSTGIQKNYRKIFMWLLKRNG